MTRNQFRCGLAASAGFVLLSAAVGKYVNPGRTVAGFGDMRVTTAFGDISQFLIVLIASIAMAKNLFLARGRRLRIFWSLMALSCSMWALEGYFWVHYELVLRIQTPNVFFGDIVGFLRIVPLIAAIAVAPDSEHEEQTLYLTLADFALLIFWWTYLYWFVVMPWYFTRNEPSYNYSYDVLAFCQSLVLVAAAGAAWMHSRRPWKSFYLFLLAAVILRSTGAALTNTAITRGQYYSGSIYDIPLTPSMIMLVWVACYGRSLPQC